MKKFLFILLLALICKVLHAYDFEVDGNYYNLLSTSDATVSFVGTTETRDLKIPSYIVVSDRRLSVTQIDCENLNVESLTIPESVIKINSCKGNFRYIYIPRTVKEIERLAFSGCKNLEELVLPQTMKYIEFGVFAGCTNLRNIKFPNGLEKIGGAAFSGVEFKNITIPSSVTQIGGYKGFGGKRYISFDDCRNLDTLILEDGKENLEIAFGLRYNANSRYSKGMEFYGYENVLDYIYIGRNICTINSDISYGILFFGKEAEVVVFGDNCTTIISLDKYNMYGYNYSMSSDVLESITFGKKIEEIPSYSKSQNLMKVYVRANRPQKAKGFSSNTYIHGTLYVPKGTKNKYKSASVWKEFWNIEEYDIMAD